MFPDVFIASLQMSPCYSSTWSMTGPWIFFLGSSPLHWHACRDCVHCVPVLIYSVVSQLSNVCFANCFFFLLGFPFLLKNIFCLSWLLRTLNMIQKRWTLCKTAVLEEKKVVHCVIETLIYMYWVGSEIQQFLEVFQTTLFKSQ